MNYHLSRQGQTLGTFSIEELQAQRRAGELTGRELVWRAGMAEWEPLDRVLSQVAAGTAPPPLPASATPRHANLAWVWLVVALGGILVFAGIIWVGVQGYRAGRRTQTVFSQSGSGDEVAIAGKAITWHSNTLTEKDIQKRSRAFRQRQWVDAYQKYGDTNQPYYPEALQFLQTFIAHNYGSDRGATNDVDPQPLGDKLAANPACTDPVIFTLAASTSIELHEGIRRLELALTRFESSKYLAYPKWYATIELADHVSDIGENAGRIRALDSSALELFKRMFADGSIKPEDQPEIVDVLLYGWARNFFSRNAAEVTRLAKDTGKDFQWLSLVVDGNYHIDEAWRARGSGTADSVSEKGWEGFSSHLGQARTSLTKAWQLRPDLPEAASRMITVAMADPADYGAQQMRQWFDRALAAQLDDPHAWSDFRWGLRPRWSGSLEAMRALGVAAVNTGRFDTDVPRKFFDIVSDLEAEQRPAAGHHIYGRSDLWPTFQQMYEGYIAEPSQAASLQYWRGAYAVVAYFAGHYDTARKQLEPLNWSVSDWALSGWGKDLSLMPLEVAARTSEVGARVDAAEAASRRPNPAESLRLYRELSAATNLDARTREFVLYRVGTLELEQRLRSGDWVDFLPTADHDPNWFTLRGDWKRLPDGAIEVRSGPGGHMLVCRSRVGPDFEVRGEFEIIKSSTKSFQGGLVMGLPSTFTYDWHSFRIKRNDVEGDLASFAEGWSSSQVYQKLDLSSERNSFVFRYQGGRATASVNGHEVFQQTPPPRGLHLSRRDFLLGLGAFNDMNDTVIRYRNLQVHWLAPRTSRTAQPAEEE